MSLIDFLTLSYLDMFKRAILFILKEPFLYFLLMGGVLYAGYANFVAPGQAIDDRVIVLPRALKADGLPMADQKRLKIIIDNEILYREAWRLHLYEKDDVVRNRLIQKMHFATMADISSKAPSQADILQFYQAKPPESMLPEAYSYEQRYFSKPTSLTADDLYKIKLKLNQGMPVESHTFYLGNEFKSQTVEKMGNSFGGEFLKGFDALNFKNLSLWQGPVESVYGYHFIRVKYHAPPQQAPLDQVRDTLSEKIASKSLTVAYEQKLSRLAEKYKIKYE